MRTRAGHLVTVQGHARIIPAIVVDGRCSPIPESRWRHTSDRLLDVLDVFESGSQFPSACEYVCGETAVSRATAYITRAVAMEFPFRKAHRDAARRILSDTSRVMGVVIPRFSTNIHRLLRALTSRTACAIGLHKAELESGRIAYARSRQPTARANHILAENSHEEECDGAHAGCGSTRSNRREYYSRKRPGMLMHRRQI